MIVTRSILALGYLWHPLGNGWIHSLSKLRMVATARLWGGSFWNPDRSVEATHLNTILRAIEAGAESPEMSSAYRQASRKLMQAYGRA